MSIFAIADTHLSFFPGGDKSMGVFGHRWEDHEDRLAAAWNRQVREDDTVVIAGDISWAMRLDEAEYDLRWINDLPGKKILLKGNHDLWWSGINKLNSLYEGMRFLQNDCVIAEKHCICGSRGWLTPDSDDFREEDDKIYKRELIRLRMSLESGAKATNENGDIERIIGFLHYPPVTDTRMMSGFHELFREYGVKDVYYGHLHGEEAFKRAVQGQTDGVDYHLISLDYLNCNLMKVVI